MVSTGLKENRESGRGFQCHCTRACFLHGALRDDWRAVLLQSWYGWMIRVLEEGYRLSKMDELNGKVFVLRSTVDKVLGHSRIEI